MSDLPFDITDELRGKLHALGWSEDRRVDISASLAKATAAGWQIFPLARAVIEQFDGIGQWSDYMFDVEDVSNNWTYRGDGQEVPDFETFEKVCAQKIYPMAEFNGWSPILMTDKGLLVQFVGEQAHWLGSTPQEAFEALFSRMYRCRTDKEFP